MNCTIELYTPDITPETEMKANKYHNPVYDKFIVFTDDGSKFAKFRDGDFLHWVNNKKITGVKFWGRVPEQL